jgi:anthranilate phosphoribosyltransferase
MRLYIDQINKGVPLSRDQISIVMEMMISAHATHEEIKEFLLALNKKGPTVEEITAAALIMRKFVIPIPSKHSVILDTCGTGGDHKHTFNISTVCAFVLAASGVVVAKHGNRSVSSKCGSADVLEYLGINLQLEERYVSHCLNEVGMAFLFAQRLHPAMKNVAPARKELGVKTIFNILGPLTNPANATHQVMGVYHPDLVVPMAKVLKNLGLKKALVVHGLDGLDEITTTTKTMVAEFNGDEVIDYIIDPQELNMPLAKESDLTGGDVSENARIVVDILNGQIGPKRDIVVLNSAYGLYLMGIVSSIQAGINMAAHAIDSKRALQKLDQLQEFTNRVR